MSDRITETELREIETILPARDWPSPLYEEECLRRLVDEVHRLRGLIVKALPPNEAQPSDLAYASNGDRS